MIGAEAAREVEEGEEVNGKRRGVCQVRVELTLSIMFIMSWILSETLAPPRMARTGLDGVSSTFANASSSLATRKPHAFVSKPSPTIDECARWAVPKASLT